MDKDNLFELGYIQKIHGLKGEVVIYLDVNYPEEYSELGSIFIEIDEGLIPFFVSKISIQGNKARVQLDEIESRESAEKLRSKKVYLPIENLRKLEGNQFYYHEIIGFQAYDQEEKLIGVVKNVFEMPGDDLISIDHNGGEVLVPLSDDIFISIDRNSERINLKLPEGLIEVYLSDDKNEN